jgi:uncharacterized pyridoxamine 5'-phosphate oxidase family protein
VHETADDLRELQGLLDESHTAAGEHMRSIFTDERRLSATALAELLTGVCVLDLGTVTAKGEPRVAPVDGLFFRAKWHFGSSPSSARFRHIEARPAVSAAHTRGEELAVVVHGTARVIDVAGEFRRFLVEVYGGDWEDWGSGAPYAVIEPSRMYTFAHAPA